MKRNGAYRFELRTFLALGSFFKRCNGSGVCFLLQVVTKNTFLLELLDFLNVFTPYNMSMDVDEMIYPQCICQVRLVVHGRSLCSSI